MGAAWVLAAGGSEWFGEIGVACAYLFTSACLVVLSHCFSCVWFFGTLARDFTRLLSDILENPFIEKGTTKPESHQWGLWRLLHGSWWIQVFL